MTATILTRICTAGALLVSAYGLGAFGGTAWGVATAISVVVVLFTWGSSHTD